MRSSYLAYATAPSNAGGAMRHGRQRSSGADAVKGSPQQRHTSPSRTGISIQQTSQIGAEEKRGRGEPQREQQAGNSTDPAASRGLRSTRATARHAAVWDSADGGTSIVMEPESLRKTHLDSEGAGTRHLLTFYVYPDPTQEASAESHFALGFLGLLTVIHSRFIRNLRASYRLRFPAKKSTAPTASAPIPTSGGSGTLCCLLRSTCSGPMSTAFLCVVYVKPP